MHHIECNFYTPYQTTSNIVLKGIYLRGFIKKKKKSKHLKYNKVNSYSL